MAIENIKTKEFLRLLREQGDELEIVDVREPEEYNIIRVEGSKLIPLKDLISRLNEVDWNKDVVFLCRSGARSRMASEMVAASGKKVKNLEGGIKGVYLDGDSGILLVLKDKVSDYF